MKTPLTSDALKIDDLAHAARRFRTVLQMFETNLDLLFKNSSLSTVIDHAALASAFSNWRLRFDATKYLADTNRHDFVIYAAGLMLKELVAAAPLKTQPRPPDDNEVVVAADQLLTRWPEGYAYTSFCLSVAGAILREMGEIEPEVGGPSDDPAFWDSFRENTLESPASAIAFFDLVCGKEPNWDAPDVPWLRKALKQKRELLKGPT